MRDFFKPWRRKIGVVTLVMACGLVALWMRSWYWWEELIVLTTNDRCCSIFSNQGKLCWCDWHEQRGETLNNRYWQLDAVELRQRRPTENVRRFLLGQTATVRFPPGRNAYASIWIADTMFAAFGSTSLSALLLLCKPRQTKKPELLPPEPEHA